MVDVTQSDVHFKSSVHPGVQAVTSLLLSTLLRPNLGDPTSSVPMHTYRSNDLLFLGSRCVYCISTFS